MNDHTLPIDMDSDTFAEMKKDITEALQKLIRSCKHYRICEGELTIKVNVDLAGSMELDGKFYDVPRFTHKVTAAMTMKSEKKGQLAGNYILVDGPDGQWAIQPAYSQTRMTNA